MAAPAQLQNALDVLRNDYDYWCRKIEQAEHDEEVAQDEPDARLRHQLEFDVEQLWQLIDDNRQELLERCEDLVEYYDYMNRDQQEELNVVYEGVRA